MLIFFKKWWKEVKMEDSHLIILSKGLLKEKKCVSNILYNFVKMAIQIGG